MSTSWNVKISELESTTNFSTGDQFVIVQDGETVKIAGSELAASIVSLTNLATRPYVDAIVDLAPETLDTLRELAQAIDNDPNFAATITEAINTKITAEDWEALWNTKNTYHLVEGSNLYFTNERARASVFDNDDLINFINGGQVGNVQLTHLGVQDYNHGMDVYSPEGHEWVQLNYADKHYVWVTTDFVGIDLTKDNGDYIAWKFDKDGVLNLPEGGDIVDANGVSVLGSSQNLEIVAGAGIEVDTVNGVVTITATGGSGEYPSAPTFTTVTATQLNVQNVEFTGTGAVTFTSGNDLNFEAAGNITFNGEQVITKTQLKAIVAASTDFADFKARVALL